MDLREQDAPHSIMQADESLYLHPGRARLPGPSAMVIGVDDHPDVVLEVDHTTDVRRGKLALYESWGFPEVQARAEERARLCRLAALRFDDDTAQRLAVLLDQAEPERLEQAGLGMFECQTGAEFLARVAGQDPRRG